MKIHTFYRVVVWLPLALPAVVALIVHGLDLHPRAGAMQDVVEILLSSLVYGGPTYTALALAATWWIGERPEQQIRQVMYRAPLGMAAVFVAFALVTGVVVGARGPFVAVAVLGGLVSILLGYCYVLVVVLLRKTTLA